MNERGKNGLVCTWILTSCQQCMGHLWARVSEKGEGGRGEWVGGWGVLKQCGHCSHPFFSSWYSTISDSDDKAEHLASHHFVSSHEFHKSSALCKPQPDPLAYPCPIWNLHTCKQVHPIPKPFVHTPGPNALFIYMQTPALPSRPTCLIGNLHTRIHVHPTPKPCVHTPGPNALKYVVIMQTPAQPSLPTCPIWNLHTCLQVHPIPKPYRDTQGPNAVVYLHMQTPVPLLSAYLCPFWNLHTPPPHP